MNATDVWDGARHALLQRGVTPDGRAVGGSGAAAPVRLAVGHARVDYTARLVAPLTRAAIANLATTPAPVGKWLLVAPYVSRELAAECRTLGVEFVDAAGNMSLVLPGRVIDVEGRRPREHPTLSRRPGRTFQPSGLRIVFALLCEPRLAAAPLRVLAEETGLSLGSVQRVMFELERDGYLDGDRTERRVHRTRELFDKWVEAYDRVLRPRLLLGQFDTDDLSPWITGRVALGDGEQWGGESAAALLTDHLRPARAVVYSDAVPARLVRKYRLRPAGPAGGAVEFRERFWGTATARTAPPSCVPAPLVYADLLSTAESRQVETARLLRESDAALRRIDAR